MERELERLKQLSNAFGVSGDEKEVREIIRGCVEPLGDSIHQDPLGNLIVKIQGSKDEAPSLLLAAHMDEIGLMVSNITKKGFLRFTTVGGWDVRILPAQAVVLRTSSGKTLDGVIGSKPPHIQTADERKKVLEFEELFIDVGIGNQEEVEKIGIRIGDRLTLPQKFGFLSGNPQVMQGKAFDDRIGCAILIELLERLKKRGKPRGSIYAGFSVQEEVGARGAGPLAYNLDPTCALVLEGTVAANTPGTKKGTTPTVMDDGPAISIMDRGLIADLRIARKLEDLAKTNKIPCQMKRPPSGATDAGRIHLTKGGIPSGVLSVPCRYIHTPRQLASINDFKNAIQLSVEFCYAFDELY